MAWMDEWVNERMHEWVHEWMNEWMNEWLKHGWMSKLVVIIIFMSCVDNSHVVCPYTRTIVQFPHSFNNCIIRDKPLVV